MFYGKIMSVFKCKRCGYKYEADVQSITPETHKCPECGEVNGEEQNTHLDKDGWDCPY